MREGERRDAPPRRGATSGTRAAWAAARGSRGTAPRGTCAYMPCTCHTHEAMHMCIRAWGACSMHDRLAVVGRLAREVGERGGRLLLRGRARRVLQHVDEKAREGERRREKVREGERRREKVIEGERW